MPNDPAMALNNVLSEFNRGFSQINAQMTQLMTKQINTLNDMAPHNVIAKMGTGSGTFSAKMSSQELVDKNIFGA